MKLDELHVDQLRTRVISERLPVPRIFPGVTSDLISAPNSSRRQHNRFSMKNLESPAFAVVAECTCDPVPILQQSHDRVLHVHIDSLMDPVILERPNHL